MTVVEAVRAAFERGGGAVVIDLGPNQFATFQASHPGPYVTLGIESGDGGRTTGYQFVEDQYGVGSSEWNRSRRGLGA